MGVCWGSPLRNTSYAYLLGDTEGVELLRDIEGGQVTERVREGSEEKTLLNWR